ncbi:replication factor-a protein [Auriscalpium vulgare]|uniref:Replication factor-a protein n=1 Tax=Auriscalpium vulgare TaxID=40419 RepID=A0ACB8SDC8_9AGAM|nr:replication factor-a protein [Auriscalpium vulgare]
MSHQLSEGICLRLASGERPDDDLWTSTPTLQFLSVKKVASGGISSTGSPNPDRYRLILSDGTHFLQAMLATQLNHLVEENLIGKNTIATIERMSCNVVQEKRLVVILGLKVLEREGPKIGNPTTLNPPQSTEAASASTAPSPAPVVTPRPPVTAQPARTSSAGRGPSIFPIEALSPYQNNWRIRARVIQKSDIKTFSNQRGDGKLFNVTLLDDSAEIKATAFNAVVDELYDKLQENKVYYISKARVNLAKKKFSTIQNEYELSLERNTEVEECVDSTDLPVIKYNFSKLSQLEELQKDAICDVIAVVKDVGDLSEIIMKSNNRPLQKRELTLVDETGYSVRLTLWGKQAEQYNTVDHPIIAFKGVKVGDFGGRSLSALSSGTMTINPDIEDAHALRGWFDDGGAQASFHSHTTGGPSASGSNSTINRAEMRTLNDVKEAGLGMSDNADFFSTRATIMHIRPETMMYPACPSEGCNKKVVDGHDGWRCEKCERSYEKPQYRYLLSMAVADYTGQAWLSGFNEVGLLVFGMTADELHEIRERDDAKSNEIVLKAQCHTYNFACKARQDTFNDTTRVRYQIQRIQALDYAAEGRSLIELLKSPWAQ